MNIGPGDSRLGCGGFVLLVAESLYALAATRRTPLWGGVAVTGGSEPVVDAHHHVWDLAAHEQPWLARPGNERLLRNFSEAELRPQAAAAGVTASVVVQTVTEQSETLELLALASGSDLVAAVVGWVDLESPGAADALAELKAGPDGGYLRGIRHPVLVEEDPKWLARPAVLAGLAAVASAGLCYDLVVLPHQLGAALAAAAAVPGLTFVLDHLGNPPVRPDVDQGWARAVGQLAALPNTACKLSGVRRPGRAAPGRQQGSGRRHDGSPGPVLRVGPRRVRAAAIDVWLGLAALHAVGELRRRGGRGPRTHGRAERCRARGGAQRRRAAGLPTHNSRIAVTQ
jgi:L-fuconolactonase